LIKKKLGDLTN